MLSTPKTKFDFEVDYSQHQAWAAHVAGILASGVPVGGTIFYWRERRAIEDWCQISDPFGKMIRGVDWPMEINGVYDLEHVACPYHPGVELPCRVRVLGEATHADAEAIHHGPLPRRKFYYEVMSPRAGWLRFRRSRR